MIGLQGMLTESAEKPLKVLHVIPSVAPCRGGPSKAVIEMVAALRELNIDAEIASSNDNGPTLLDAPLQEKHIYQGVPIRFFQRFSPPINAIREFAYSADFKHWLRANISNYNVVHVHAVFSYCSTVAMSVAREAGIPYVVRPIGQLQHWSLQQAKLKKQVYLNIIERQNIECASAVQFTSSVEKEESEQAFKLKGETIPLGINIEEVTTLNKDELVNKLNLSDAKFNILYLSRVHEKKGLDLLLKAFAKRNYDGALWIAGTGKQDYISQLKQRTHELNISKNCHFIGHVEGEVKLALLKHADLFALSSHSENFGISVLEAMAYSLPPLVSTEVALSRSIADEEIGLVCELNVTDIAEKLSFANDNRDAIKSMGARAAKYAKNHHSWQSTAKQLKRLYDSII